MLLDTEFVFLLRIRRVLGGARRSYLWLFHVSLWRRISTLPSV